VDNGNEICELADVWSLAVVAAEILSGEIPFDSSHCRQLTIEAFVDALGNDLRPSLPPTTEDWMRAAVSTADCLA
jgi:serine/threonine protein kinase